jgi:hypothetical protein
LDFTSITFPNQTVKPNQNWQGVRQMPFVLPLPGQRVAFSIPMNVTYKFLGVRKTNGKDMAVLAIKGGIPSTKIPIQEQPGPGPQMQPGPGAAPGRQGRPGGQGTLPSSITLSGNAYGTAIVDLSMNRVAKVEMVVDSILGVHLGKDDIQFRNRHEAKLTRTGDDR